VQRTALVVAVLLASSAAVVTSTTSCSDDARASGSAGLPDGAAGDPPDASAGPRPLDCAAPLQLDTAFAGGLFSAALTKRESGSSATLVPARDGSVLVRTGSYVQKIGRDGRRDPAFDGDAFFLDPDRAPGSGPMTVTQDRKIVVAFSTAGGTAFNDRRLALARLLPDGAIDRSFGEGGVTVLPNIDPTDASTRSIAPNQVEVAPDGSVYVAGYISNHFQDIPARVFVARLTASGALDMTYGEGKGYFYGPMPLPSKPIGMAVRDDGRLLLGMHGRNAWIGAPSVSASILLLFDPAGQPDPSYGTDGGLAPKELQSGGWVWGVEGNAAVLQGQSTIRRATASGELDPSFGADGSVRQSITDDAGRSFSLTNAHVRRDGSFLLSGSRSGSSSVEAFPVFARYGADGQPCGEPVELAGQNRAFETAVMDEAGAVFAARVRRADTGEDLGTLEIVRLVP